MKERALDKFPRDLTYLLHVFGSILCQHTDVDAEGLLGMLLELAEGVAALHDDADAHKSADKSLDACGGDVQMLIWRLSQTMPQAVAQMDQALRSATRH